MAQVARNTEDYGDSLPKVARNRAIRDWNQNLGPLICQEGGYYYGVGQIENQTSGFGAADNYFVPTTASDTLPDLSPTDDRDFPIDDQTSDENESRPSLIERLSPYFRKRAVEDELREYLRLEEGWSGVNSVPAPVSAVENAVSFLYRFSDVLKQPTPMVAADGEVGLYWQYQSAYVELEFAGDGMMFGYGRDLKANELFVDDVSLNSTEEMEKAISTVTRIVEEFPLDDDQDG